MPASVSLAMGLLIAVGAAFVASLIVWFFFKAIVNDEAGIRLMRGLRNDDRPGSLILFVLTGTGIVVSWIAGFFMPLYMSRTLADVPIILSLGLFAGVTGWLHWIDSVVHRIPNRIMLPLLVAMLSAYLTSLAMGVSLDSDLMGELWAKSGTPALSGLISAALLVILFAIVYLSGIILGRSTIGLGDVKLAIPIGLVAGSLSQWGLLVAVIVMNISALIHYGKHRIERKPGSIAYGPHMLIGGWTAAILTPLFL